MFKPISDFMIVELDRESGSKIALPDNLSPDQGNIYVVKDIGPGMVLDNGKLLKLDVKVNDKVLIAGKLVKFSTYGDNIFIGRAGDVVAVSRGENGKKII